MERTSRLKPLSYVLRISLLFIVVIVAAIIGLITGSVSISLKEFFNAFFSPGSNSTISQIIFDIRLPRVLYAIAVGGGLSVAGAVFQAMLMNPLAEPYILGISSGGTFGAVLSFILGISFLGTQLFAFAGSICVMLIVFFLSRRFGELEPNVLLLSGVMVGAFFSAAILLMMSLLNDSLRAAVFWLIGNLSLAEKGNVWTVLIITVTVSVILILLSNKFNLLSMGSDYAKQLGLKANQLKAVTYILSSVMIGTLVSVSGIIGFVGLLVPHVCRMIFGVDNRIVFPTSFIFGAAYLTLADTIARTLISPAELPVGAITAIIGAPIFILLLRKRFKLFL
ncbi:MAG: iron ABC transporter permease [Bacteroidota bacterium]